MAGATSLLFVYSLDYARTRLANDAKSAKKGGGERQFNGLIDVYKKTLASDGIAGLYRGFGPSVLGIVVYRGLYFGMYDSIKPVLLVGPLEGNFLASFLLGWTVTTGAGIASYPLDTVRRRMMMTSGEVRILLSIPSTIHRYIISNKLCRPSSTLLPSMLPARSWLRRVSAPSSRVLVPTSSVVLPVLVSSLSTTRSSSSSSERSSSKRLACRNPDHNGSQSLECSFVMAVGASSSGREVRSVLTPPEQHHGTTTVRRGPPNPIVLVLDALEKSETGSRFSFHYPSVLYHYYMRGLFPADFLCISSCDILAFNQLLSLVPPAFSLSSVFSLCTTLSDRKCPFFFIALKLSPSSPSFPRRSFIREPIRVLEWGHMI